MSIDGSGDQDIRIDGTDNYTFENANDESLVVNSFVDKPSEAVLI
jgi:hypothetical protein